MELLGYFLGQMGLTSTRATKRLLLRPFVIEAALARLGERRLSAVEQQIVLRAVGNPDKVNWPDWWEVRRGKPAEE